MSPGEEFEGTVQDRKFILCSLGSSHHGGIIPTATPHGLSRVRLAGSLCESSRVWISWHFNSSYCSLLIGYRVTTWLRVGMPIWRGRNIEKHFQDLAIMTLSVVESRNMIINLQLDSLGLGLVKALPCWWSNWYSADSGELFSCWKAVSFCKIKGRLRHCLEFIHMLWCTLFLFEQWDAQYMSNTILSMRVFTCIPKAVGEAVILAILLPLWSRTILHGSSASFDIAEFRPVFSATANLRSLSILHCLSSTPGLDSAFAIFPFRGLGTPEESLHCRRSNRLSFFFAWFTSNVWG